MIKHSRKIISFVAANGMDSWEMQGADVYFPETDMEIALGMFSIKDDTRELILLKPIVLNFGPKTNIPENVPEEKEIPERDR